VRGRQVQIQVDVFQFVDGVAGPIRRAARDDLPQAGRLGAPIHDVGSTMRLGSDDFRQQHRMNQVTMCLTLHRLGQRFVAGAEKREREEELIQTSPSAGLTKTNQ